MWGGGGGVIQHVGHDRGFEQLSWVSMDVGKGEL